MGRDRAWAPIPSSGSENRATDSPLCRLPCLRVSPSSPVPRAKTPVFCRKCLSLNTRFPENACSVENCIQPLRPHAPAAYTGLVAPVADQGRGHVPPPQHSASAGPHLHLLRPRRNHAHTHGRRPPTHHLLPRQVG